MIQSTLQQLIGDYVSKAARNIINSIVCPVYVIFFFGFKSITSLLDLKTRIAADPTIADEFKEQMFNTFEAKEGMLFSSKPNSQLRGTLAQHPLFVNYRGSIKATNYDGLSDGINRLKTKATSRDRGYANFPMAICLFICGLIIMNDSLSRAAFIRNTSPDTLVPSVWNEFNKSHRNGSVGGDYLKCCIDQDWLDFLKLLNLQDTIWDPKWLQNDANMAELLTVLTGISNSDGNYIKFENASRFPIDAGRMLSASGICIEFGVLTGVISASLFPGASIPAGAETVYYTDQAIAGRYLSTNLSKTGVLTQFNVRENGFKSGEVILMYILGRMCGTFTNKSPDFAPADGNLDRPRASSDKPPAPAASRKSVSSDDLSLLVTDVMAKIISELMPKQFIKTVIREIRNSGFNHKKAVRSVKKDYYTKFRDSVNMPVPDGI